jgi:hypothetical protein
MIDSCPVFDLFRQPTATPDDPAVVRRRQILLSAAVAALLAGPHARGEQPPGGLAAFTRDVSPQVRPRLEAAGRPLSDKQYRQIEPSLFYCAERHAAALESLPPDRRLDALAALAVFLQRKREATGDMVVIGSGRRIIGLLDPARGLDRKEITAIAAAYGAPQEVFKQDQPDETIRGVADAFLAAVGDAAGQGTPTTVVVLGHGAPEEIQSYSIPFGRLADTLVAGAIGRTPQAGETAPVDLGHLTLICDDCYSADFHLNLAGAIEAGCRDRKRPLRSLPVLIAGTNRDRVGHADFGEKFVPHFWREVIELFYIRQPRPRQVTLRDFFEKVDNTMFGYGRAPIVEGSKVVGYRVVDPELFQDPVFFVPLDDDDLATLRGILGLDPAAPLPRILDIG